MYISIVTPESYVLRFTHHNKTEFRERLDNAAFGRVNRKLRHQAWTPASTMKASTSGESFGKGVRAKSFDMELSRGFCISKRLIIYISLADDHSVQT
jgi:hypothetical protein